MRPRIIITLGNFFLAISTTLVSYTLISYLSHFIPETYIGLSIAVGGLFAVLAFIFLPRLVAKFGSQQLALVLVCAEIITLFAAAATANTIASAICIIVVISIQPLLLYELDLLLEATIEKESETARARTFFLTGGNFGNLAAPLLIGALLTRGENYSLIFLAAAALLVTFAVLFAARTLPRGEAPDNSHVQKTLTHLLHDHDLAAVTFGHFILYLFYMWAPFYIPVYFRTVLGIPWSTLGWMFSVMLIPYVLLEYPAGWAADRILGDKKLMLAGFLIAGSALATIGLLTPHSSILSILMVLVATRIGSSLIESMTEGHFFRCVSEKDIVSVSVFRGVWPLAMFAAPLVAVTILFFGNYQLLFFLTGGFIALAGAASVFFIRDFNPKKGHMCLPF